MELKEKLQPAANISAGPIQTTENSQTMAFDVTKSTSRVLDPQTFERIASTAHQAVDKFAHLASESVHSLELKSKQMAETGLEVVSNSRKFIQDKPGTSIGIALVAGFLLRHLFALSLVVGDAQ